MDEVNKAIAKKRGRGRPRKTDAATTLVPVAFSKAAVRNLDRWIKDNDMRSRSGAIRWMVEQALAAPAPRKAKGSQLFIKAREIGADEEKSVAGKLIEQLVKSPPTPRKSRNG
jgi:hypothetical protein